MSNRKWDFALDWVGAFAAAFENWPDVEAGAEENNALFAADAGRT